MKLPKIQLGKSTRDRNLIHLDNDCNTTADFGSFQPIFSKMLIPGDKIKIDLENYVRAAPMPLPTLSRINYRVYSQFVPISEIYHPFEQLMSGMAYGSAVKTYVPTTLPYTTIHDIMRFMMNQSLFTIYIGERESATSGKGFTAVEGQQQVSAQIHNVNNFLDLGLTSAYYSKDINRSNGGFFISPESADYQVLYDFEENDVLYLVCFRWSRKMRNLRKIILGLGGQLDFSNTRRFGITKLAAFYKAWFDKFAPKTSATGLVNWDSTSCFKLFEYIEQNDAYSWINPNNSLFGAFLNDLSQCYYYKEADFVTAHTVSPALSSTTVISPSACNTDILDTSLVAENTNVNTLPYISSGVNLEDVPIDYLNILQKLTRFVKKDTIIGGKLDSWFLTHFGRSPYAEHKSYDLGKYSVNINVSDLMATADTYNSSTKQGAMLGEFSGNGTGHKSSGKFSFEADCHGFLFVYSVIVPEAARVQPIDYENYALTRFELYSHEFDGMTFEISNKDVLNGSQHVSRANNQGVLGRTSDEPFGFIPLYTNFKVKNNILNGDLSLPSTKTAYQGYTLDTLVTEDYIDYEDVNAEDGEIGSIDYNTVHLPTATPELRSIAKYPWLGNFNRIFYFNEDDMSYKKKYRSDDSYNQNPPDDNFVVHNVMQVDYWTSMKPISESFDTESEKDSVSVKKA